MLYRGILEGSIINDEVKFVDVVGELAARMHSGAESEGITFQDALKKANVILTSGSGTVIDREGMPTGKNYIAP